ncbi:Protein CBG07385 [Caenorhabditis briggsae]|uniref:Protein CBG07385 n=1 Tax=Caenorhabditis briggsae TaxID=6238 RepID=A8X4W0_CAEBR|nr:Protein CBG07385 [Caenorhabditis briggsae]CAP27670.1 Protein CBG07385 [Caenorhabditis briggsae]
MSLLLKTLIFVAVVQYGTAHRPTTLTDEQVLKLVHLSCNDAKYFCPAERYLVKIGPYRIFNRFAVLKSEEVGLLKTSDIPLTDLFGVFRNTFCCTEGSCLAECGVYPVNEKSIISNFHDIYKQVFALNIAELNGYEEDYIEYLRNGKQRGFVPARIEELYDILHENEDTIIDMLAKVPQ